MHLGVEDESAQAVVKEVIDFLQITEMEFGQTHQMLAQNPATAEFVMAAQQGKLTQPVLSEQPKITKQKTLQVFEVSQKLAIETIKRLKT